MLYLVIFFLFLIALCYLWIGMMKVLEVFFDGVEAVEKKRMWAVELEQILENQAKAARIAEYTKHATKF